MAEAKGDHKVGRASVQGPLGSPSLRMAWQKPYMPKESSRNPGDAESPRGTRCDEIATSAPWV